MKRLRASFLRVLGRVRRSLSFTPFATRHVSAPLSLRLSLPRRLPSNRNNPRFSFIAFITRAASSYVLRLVHAVRASIFSYSSHFFFSFFLIYCILIYVYIHMYICIIYNLCLMQLYIHT